MGGAALKAVNAEAASGAAIRPRHSIARQFVVELTDADDCVTNRIKLFGRRRAVDKKRIYEENSKRRNEHVTSVKNLLLFSFDIRTVCRMCVNQLV